MRSISLREISSRSRSRQQKQPPSFESGRFYQIITKDYSLPFSEMTLLPPAVVEKTKVFGSVLFE
jgi:hypothetical protein